ncbi:unnamed protein product [Tilletia laevis]|nr:unnamed protein product [Tilletia laevis]CAD6975376.1 unnamed protein product [Tilletia controversa]
MCGETQSEGLSKPGNQLRLLVDVLSPPALLLQILAELDEIVAVLGRQRVFDAGLLAKGSKIGLRSAFLGGIELSFQGSFDVLRGGLGND